jgi:L-lactate dehydrogenase
MKISITGTGRAGTAIAFALVLRRIGEELVLVSRDPAGKAEGDAIDLSHASLYLDPKPVTVRCGTIDDSAGSQIIIVTNSRRLETVQTRRDYAAANAPIIRELIPQLARGSPEAVFIIITNPVDPMTWLAIRSGGLDPRRVIGTGTLIDTGRFRALIARQTGIHSHDVRAYILGEHGESMVPALSQATAGGVRLPESDASILASFREARQAGYDVFHRKGYTDYAIAACVTMIAAAVASDTHEVMPVSTLLDGQFGIRDVCLSLPCVIGRRGILRVLEPELSAGEVEALRTSAQVVRGMIEEVKA